jgi:hypothetical protein
MDCLQQQGQHAEQHQGLEQSAGQCTATQHAWQCVTPALASTVKLLLHMSVTSAEFVSSGGSSQQVPKEMCSMSALNLSWANLTRLLVTIPVDVRMQVSAGSTASTCFSSTCYRQHALAGVGVRPVLVCSAQVTFKQSRRSRQFAAMLHDKFGMVLYFAAGIGGAGLHARAAVCTTAAA